MVSRVDGGMIYASAYSDALGIRRSPALKVLSPSSDTSVFPFSGGRLSGSNMFGRMSLGTPSVISGIFNVHDTAAIQGENSTPLAMAINAPDLQGGLTQWIEPKSVDLNPGGGIDVETWQGSPLDGVLAPTTQAYFMRSSSSTEPLSRLVSSDYPSPSGQLPLETLREQEPVIIAVEKHVVAFATFLPHNNAPSRLAEDPIPRDAMLTPTVTEVVTRMLKDGDDHRSLNGRDKITPRIATGPG